MKGNHFFTDLREILGNRSKQELSTYEITTFRTVSTHLSEACLLPLYMDSYLYLVAESGQARISVNYKTYHLREYSIAVLTPLHILQVSQVSSDFRCLCLLVNKPFLDIVPSMEKVFKHLNRSLKLYNDPVTTLLPTDHSLLLACIRNIQEKIGQTTHLLQQEIIQNLFVTFLLEWINIYESYASQNPSEVDLNRSEQILKSFISLLKVHFKQQHTVAFYAEKLSITPQYLTLIIKKLTGQTINEFIYEMLYSEARILLTRSGLSIQQISDELHFSDSSAFCKFFRRRSGVSPLRYRKR